LLTVARQEPVSADLEGQTCLITGANTGIGRATAVGLARRGAHVLLACRSAERSRDVLDEIEALPGPGGAEFLALDLADLDSVRACASGVVDRGGAVHLLINNAGVAGHKGVTAQGFELTFGVNHLGHFLLTTLLLDTLRKSRPARVVTVASTAHRGTKDLDFAALQQPTRSPGGLAEYQVSKLCNVLFTQELARRLDGDGVTAVAVHPGVISSDIWRQVPWPIRPVMKLFMGSVASGAARTLECATDPDPADTTGAYYERGRPTPPSPVATPALAATLWHQSVTWTSP
jgi:NAD(P)-dependent dehydrogenase (short-subunit alcohol dehydrogenase family)